jgi:dTDP-4-amino-4,6-dideoxygalactose transaminase
MTSNTPAVPFLDLAILHRELQDELISVCRTALETAGFIGGPMVERFEDSFARFCQAKYCVGVGSGTDALRFALMASGVEPGDLVLTVPNTFIATTEAISQAGGRPHFIDVDERTCTMDPVKLAEYLESECSFHPVRRETVHYPSGRAVRAMVPVHLYGQMADMDALQSLASRYNITLIEDACQAHGAEYYSEKEGAWKRAGSIGRAAAFSFYPGKNLGACGEAGAVTTNDEALARKVRMLRDHGQAQKYYHTMEGYNGRLDAIQAGILNVKLEHLPEWNRRRRECASYYGQLLKPLAGDVTLPWEGTWSRGCYHLYVVRTEDRDGLQTHLASRNIGTGIHYPIPLHLQDAYKDLGFKRGQFPVSEKLSAQILSLPMYPQLSREQQQRVADAISEFVGKKVPSAALAS